MASNIDKVEEKVSEDIEKAIKTSKTPVEMERKLDSRDVSYKIKDSTKEGQQQEYSSNEDIHQV